MKILIIHHSSVVGGGTISGLDVAKMLHLLGHEVVFAAPCKGDILISKCSELNIKLDIAGVPPLFTYHSASTGGFKCISKYLISSIRLNKRWFNYIKSVAPDLVILNSVTQAPLLSIIQKLGIRSICTIRETYRTFGSRLINRMLRRLVSKADAALYLTSFDKLQWSTSNRIQEVLPDVVDEERYSVHTSIEIQEFKRINHINSNIKYVLYLGGTAYAKGLKDLLDAYNIISNHTEKIGLFILGNLHQEKVSLPFRILNFKEIRYRKECQALIQKFKDKHFPVFDVGLVSDTSYWYEASSAVAFPVKMVHQPRPAYEAGYYHKPIVLPLYENFSDYLNNGENGLYYEANNIQSLANKLETLLSTEGLVESMGENNYNIYLHTHSFNVGIDILDKVLRMMF